MLNKLPLDSKFLDLLERSAVAIATSKQRIAETLELLRRSDELAIEPKAWAKPSETDGHQDTARQPYGSREKDSAEGFADVKLFNSTEQNSRKKMD